MKKLFLFLGIIIILSGCSYDRYKIKVLHTDSTIDTIIVKTRNINNIYINKKEQLTDKCGCSVYSDNIKSFKPISKIHKKQTPKKSFKEYNLSLKKYIPTFLYIISFLFVILFYIKSKSSIMKTITKYTVYGILVILLIKIGIVLVKYLPPFIELLLK